MDATSLNGGLKLDSKTFKQLLDSQSLVDCTIACEGGNISAHKLVLSACSSYLAKILTEHPVEHPIIILPELKIEDVRTLIHYMYTGELIKTETLNSAGLLRTAAILSVNSLNDFLNSRNFDLNSSTAIFDNQFNYAINNNNISGSGLDSTSITGLVANSSHSSSSGSTVGPDQLLLFGPTSGRVANLNDSVVSATNLSTSSMRVNGLGTVASNILTPSINNNNPGKTEFLFKCPVCHNDFQTICSFEYHMQRMHSVTSFGCEICHKPFASLRYVLTDHMRRCHGWKPDQKMQC